MELYRVWSISSCENLLAYNKSANGSALGHTREGCIRLLPLALLHCAHIDPFCKILCCDWWQVMTKLFPGPRTKDHNSRIKLNQIFKILNRQKSYLVGIWYLQYEQVHQRWKGFLLSFGSDGCAEPNNKHRWHSSDGTSVSACPRATLLFCGHWTCRLCIYSIHVKAWAVLLLDKPANKPEKRNLVQGPDFE